MVKVGWLRSDPSKKYAIKSMKKASIIQSKHVDHIENEKIILGKLDHPFSVSSLKREISSKLRAKLITKIIFFSWTMMGSSKTVVTFTLPLNCWAEATCSLSTEV